MGTISGTERRREFRVDKDDISLRLSSAGKALPDVQIRDVSALGFGIQVNHELKPGQTLAFELLLPNGPVRGTAAVVWAEPFHMGYRGGLKIVSLNWFARRRLRRVLGGQNDDGGWLDTVLYVLAGLVALFVLWDYLSDDAARKALLERLKHLPK